MKIEEAINILLDGKWWDVLSEDEEYLRSEEFMKLQDITDNAIEAIKETQWISMKDRPPEESGEYIVMIYGEENPTFLVYRKDMGRFCDDYDNKYNVTHWKPFPKAPEV